MEYVKVIFPEKREVIIDGQEEGSTGDVLFVVKGTHTIGLSDPQNYTPKSQECVVKDTTFVKPMEVTFAMV
jgi:hypothetical protein